MQQAPAENFLTLYGLLGIGSTDLLVGGLPCHINGSYQDFVILRYLGGESFEVISPAIILDRRQR
jgi:hypothetical protein